MRATLPNAAVLLALAACSDDGSSTRPLLLGVSNLEAGLDRADALLEIDTILPRTVRISGFGLRGFTATGLAFDPRFGGTLYGIDPESDQALVVDRGKETAFSFGALGLDGAQALAYRPSTGVLYGADGDSAVLFTVDPFDGEGLPVGSLAPHQVTGLAFQPGTGVLFACTPTQLLTVDPDTAAPTVVGSTGVLLTDIAFASTGILFGVDAGADQLVTLDPATGAPTAVGPLGFAQVDALTFDDMGVLLGVDQATRRLLTIDTLSGAGTAGLSLGFGLVRALTRDPVTDTAFGLDDDSGLLLEIDLVRSRGRALGAPGVALSDLAFDPAAGVIWGVDTAGAQLVAVDPADGSAAVVGPFGIASVEGLAVDPLTGTLFGTDTGADQLLTIDTTTGAATPVGALGVGALGHLDFDGTGALLGLAGASTLVTVDTVTGAASLLRLVPLASGLLAGPGQAVHVVNLATGVATLQRFDLPGTDATTPAVLGLSAFDGLATDPEADVVFAGNTTLFTVDVVRGGSTSVGPIGRRIHGLAWDGESDTLYGVDSAELGRLDVATGLYTSLGATGFTGVLGLTWDRALGVLWGSDVDTGQLISIDPATGAGTAVGAIGFTRVEALHLDPGTGQLFGSDTDTRTLVLIDRATGAGLGVRQLAERVAGLAGTP